MIQKLVIRTKDRIVTDVKRTIYHPFAFGFIPISLLLTLLPANIKIQCALKNGHLSSTWLPAFFIHANLMHWLINIIFASILMHVCKKLFGYSSTLLTLVFVMMGILSGLFTGLYLEFYGFKFAVLGCSGGVVGLLGLCFILLINRLMHVCYKHVYYQRVRHLGRMVLLLLATAVAYLDPSGVSTILGDTSFIVHLLGLLLGMLVGIILLSINHDSFCHHHE